MDKIIARNDDSLMLLKTCFERFLKLPLRFSARAALYEKEYIAEYHHSDFPEFWYCKSGRYRHLINGKSYNLTEGSFVIIPPGTFHGFEIFADCPTELVCVQGTLSYFLTLRERQKAISVAHLFLSNAYIPLKTVFYFSGDEQKKLEQILSELCAEDYSDKTKRNGLIRQKTEELFSLPSFSVPEKLIPKYANIAETKLAQIMPVCTYLRNHYALKIHREDVIKISTLCQTDFFKYFKLLTGTTYSLYLQMIRVRHARYLCTFSDFPLDYISDKCGFGNVTYMEKLLRQYFGISAGSIQKFKPIFKRKNPLANVSQDYFEREAEFF